MAEIKIIQTEPGQYEAVRDRRIRLVPGFSDLAHIKQIVQQQRLPNERVYLVEDDGYLTDITREFDRVRPPRVRV